MPLLPTYWVMPIGRLVAAGYCQSGIGLTITLFLQGLACTQFSTFRPQAERLECDGGGTGGERMMEVWCACTGGACCVKMKYARARRRESNKQEMEVWGKQWPPHDQQAQAGACDHNNRLRRYHITPCSAKLTWSSRDAFS